MRWFRFLNGCAFVTCLTLAATANSHACTTVLVSGRATNDGRPLLWKNRDTWQHQNEVLFDNQGVYAFIGVVNAEGEKRVWMGSNETGFCIENSLSKDLRGSDGIKGGIGNGSLIRLALETCSTADDFRELLRKTAHPGRRTQGNFGVIDAKGNAVMFEVGPVAFQEFDANDPVVAPRGIIVRANTSVMGSTTDTEATNSTRKTSSDSKRLANQSILEHKYSGIRYCRARDLCVQQLDRAKIDLRYLLQEVARDIKMVESSQSNPDHLVNTARTLNRNTTVSAVVFHGVQPDEAPSRTTMWTLLGEPAFSIAVPSWVAQGKIAKPLNGDGSSSICELSVDLRQRNYLASEQRNREMMLAQDIETIAHRTISIENQTLARTLTALQSTNPLPPSANQLWQLHSQAADDALNGLTQLCQVIQKRNRRSDSTIKIHTDYSFNETDGTKLADTADSVGHRKWNGGLTDCRTRSGCLRIRRSGPSSANRFVDISPNVRVSSDNQGLPKMPRGWIVMEVDGWNMTGKQINETIRIGFASRATEDIHTAGLEIRRVSESEVRIRGVGFGEGSTLIHSSKKWPAKQNSRVAFVIELDKVAGNSGEGDAGGVYRIYAKNSDDSEYKPMGSTGRVRRLRNGNHMALHVEGGFGDNGEYFDIARIFYTTSNPLQ